MKNIYLYRFVPGPIYVINSYLYEEFVENLYFSPPPSFAVTMTNNGRPPGVSLLLATSQQPGPRSPLIWNSAEKCANAEILGKSW